MPPSTFFGRELACEQLHELVRGSSVVTVTGPGGIGKTRLVTEAIRSLPSDVARMSTVCELASLPADATVDAVSNEAGWPTPEAAAASLARTSTLLVLDNCEHVLDSASLFVERALRADEALRIVVTSREPLGVQGERVLVLPPLALPTGELDVESSPAVRLFLDRVSAAGGTWDRTPATLATVAVLCRQLDGLPLAIELAAARARALAPGDLLDLMNRRLDLLHRSGRGSAPARHRSLRAAIDVSADLLDDDERSFLQALGVFAGPFDIELARAVAAPPGTDRLGTVDLLGRLVDRSLVVADADGATHYRLLEVLREYAVEGLIRSGDDVTVAERYVDVMTAEAQEITAQGVRQWTGALLARIAVRFHDLLAAITWCLEHDDRPDRAHQLLVPLLEAAHTRSVEVMAIGRRLLDRWPEPAPGRGLAMAIVTTAAVMAGDRGCAFDVGGRALDEPDDGKLVHLVTHRALGLAARAEGEHRTAHDHFVAAGALAGDLEAASFQREIAAYEASMLDLLGEHGQAVARIDAVVEEAIAAGDVVTEPWARQIRITMALQAGEWHVAREQSRLAREAVTRVHDHTWPSTRLRLEALLDADDAALQAFEHGWRASRDDWERAIDTAASQGVRGQLALTLRAAAVAAHRLGHDDVARGLIEAAPASTALADLPEMFPTELHRLEQAAARRGPRPDVASSLQLARVALALEPEAPGAGDDAPAAPEPVDAVAPATGVLVREGELWTVEYAGRRASVRHLKGLLDLAVLLRAPDEEVHCLQLVGGADVARSAGPALDERARREYQARIRELQEEIDDAQADGSPERAERAEVELDALVTQLSEAFGLGGRARAQGSSSERARGAVTYRLRTAIKRVADVHPELGRHLDNAVRTGTWCSYRPEIAVVWKVDQGVSR